MKRHTNSILQRKRVDFDGAHDPRQKSDRQRHVLVSEEVRVKDGYDWLEQLHSSAHRQVVRGHRVH